MKLIINHWIQSFLIYKKYKLKKKNKLKIFNFKQKDKTVNYYLNHIFMIIMLNNKINYNKIYNFYNKKLRINKKNKINKNKIYNIKKIVFIKLIINYKYYCLKNLTFKKINMIQKEKSCFNR